MQVVIAQCAAWYTGRLTAHLPRATRLLLVKADGSVLLHSDGGSYKPLNWMSPPCTRAVAAPTDEQRAEGVAEV
ncbi:MAG: endonuclease NucS, partial [Micrococcales bacterium]|nr:endonuclease NucS [Micrococcales bacterium]